jgi:hypothetical protein
VSRGRAIAQRERDRASGTLAVASPQREGRRGRSLAWTSLVIVVGVGAVFWLISPTRIEHDDRDDGEREPPPEPPDRSDSREEDDAIPERSGRPDRDNASGADESP